MKHCFFFNRQEMNRLFYPSLLLLLIVFLVSGCSYSDEDDHAGEPVGLTVSPTWRDNTDDTAHVACLDVWVYSEDEQLILHRKVNKSEMGYNIFPLVGGTYKVYAMLNEGGQLVVPDYEAAMSELSLVSSSPSASPAHVYVGEMTGSYPSNTLSTFYIPVGRMQAELAVEIEGVPDGVTLHGVVRNAARGIYVTRYETTSTYQRLGLPMDGDPVEVTLPDVTSEYGWLVVAPVRLMPTCSGYSNSLIRLTMVSADGREVTSDLVAERMITGGKYVVRLKYAELKSVMHLAEIRISDWVREFVYQGEILDPQ